MGSLIAALHRPHRSEKLSAVMERSWKTHRARRELAAVTGWKRLITRWLVREKSLSRCSCQSDVSGAVPERNPGVEWHASQLYPPQQLVRRHPVQQKRLEQVVATP